MSAWPCSAPRTRPSNCRPAGALDELIASGALEDATLPAGRDDIHAQLDAAMQGSDLEQELAAMWAQLPATAESPALGAASSCEPNEAPGDDAVI